jgi:lysophospholipase L1-like esterase
MAQRGLHWGAALLFAAAMTAAVPARAEGQASAAACTAPPELVRLANPLKRVAQRLAQGQPVTVVAIGSSSTFGAGASSPVLSYPNQLAVELQTLLPQSEIVVLNRGINGEETRDMLARLDRDVLASKPDLVLWQVGSNAILQNRRVGEAERPLHDGLKRLRASGADVIVVNPQYAPKVIAKIHSTDMVDTIDAAAGEESVDLFQRFAVMRYWRLVQNMPFSAFLSPDELHMNDWSYGCIARLLAGAIAEAAMRSTMTAKMRPAK